MKNIILCEGVTDGVLLQYFMREVHQWEDVGAPKNLFRGRTDWVRRLKKEGTELDIVSCKGSSQLLPCMEHLLDINKSYTPSEAYYKLVVVTDRDECETEEDFVKSAKEVLMQNGIEVNASLKHNEWTSCSYESANGRNRNLEVLLLVIPFEDNGAMETFLLNSVSRKDSYDANIIQKGNDFVEEVDPEKRYLVQRRYVTKAKFDVYFSIRTSAAQFTQRQDILRGVKWEEYIDVQGDFKKLEDL